MKNKALIGILCIATSAMAQQPMQQPVQQAVQQQIQQPVQQLGVQAQRPQVAQPVQAVQSVPTPAAIDPMDLEIEKLKALKKDIQVEEPHITEVLQNGIKITHLRIGQGESPIATSVVQAAYIGKFKNGKVFDGSKTPIEFPLNQVIQCWSVAIPKMKVGGKAYLECPFETAYGDKGNGVVPPRTPLIFEVSLAGIKKPPPVAATQQPQR